MVESIPQKSLTFQSEMRPILGRFQRWYSSVFYKGMFSLVKVINQGKIYRAVFEVKDLTTLAFWRGNNQGPKT